MMLGYPLTNWLELGEYFIFVLILFAGVGVISYKADNYYQHELYKRKKLNQFRLKQKKKIIVYKNVS